MVAKPRFYGNITPTMTVQQASFLRDKSYLAAVTSHFFVDVLNNGRLVLLAIIAVSLQLSNAQVGIFLLLYSLGGSLSQPLFGWLADRFGARWLVVGGVGWTTSFYVLTSVLPDWPALVTLTLASLGSGAFHPSGTKVASQSSDTRRTQATAVFFMAGQVGLFVGPILAGSLLDAFGRPGYLGLPLLASLAFLGGWRWLSDDLHGHHDDLRQQTDTRPRPAALHLPRAVPAIVVIIIAYNVVSFSAQSFAPKLFAEQGYSPTYVGWITGLFMMGSAIGVFVGGTLADRVGGRLVTTLAMLGIILPVYFYIPVGDTLRFPVLLLAGFFGGMPHSIIVLMVQSLLPGRYALAAGLTLGFMFVSGAIGSYVVGVIADQIGLAVTLQGTAILPLIAVFATFFLPRRWDN